MAWATRTLEQSTGARLQPLTFKKSGTESTSQEQSSLPQLACICPAQVLSESWTSIQESVCHGPHIPESATGHTVITRTRSYHHTQPCQAITRLKHWHSFLSCRQTRPTHMNTEPCFAAPATTSRAGNILEYAGLKAWGVCANTLKGEARKGDTGELYSPVHTACSANSMKSTPPRSVTVFSLMCLARARPPKTAAPVQIACPSRPPSVTPTTSVAAAKPIVMICNDPRIQY